MLGILFASVRFVRRSTLALGSGFFSGRGGRSLSDSIFTETFVSLCSLLSDFPLPVRIIDPEIGEPLSCCGTDV